MQLLLIAALCSAVFYCIGELMGAVGAHVMSFMAEIAVVAVKTFRSSSNVRLRTKSKTKKSLIYVIVVRVPSFPFPNSSQEIPRHGWKGSY